MKLRHIFAISTLLLALPLAVPAAAQSVIYKDNTAFPRVTALNPLNEQFLISQRARVDKITRKNFGQQLRAGKANKRLLQRIIDQNVIAKSDKLDLQAMGVVLGDTMIEANRKLAWKLYEDELGISHAVCVEDTKHCIFPVTMISRRIEGGAQVNVDRIYKKGIEAVREYLPKLPYSD